MGKQRSQGRHQDPASTGRCPSLLLVLETPKGLGRWSWGFKLLMALLNETELTVVPKLLSAPSGFCLVQITSP